MKASSLTIDRDNSVLMKGPWGFGKTLAACSFALDGPVYLAYWDKKRPVELLSYFSKFGAKGKRILDNIEYDVYGAHNANEYLNKVIQLARDCRYFAVVTDSLTNLTSGAVNWSMSFRDDRKGKDKLKVIPDFDEYKVETSLFSQSIDLFRGMPCHVIWTAHPIQSTKIEGSGNSMKVSKVIRLVSYGNKVGDMSPGNFSEIYHFAKQSIWDQAKGKASTRYIASFDAIGDDFAKSNLGLTGEIDITDQLFYEVWKEKVKQQKEEINNALNEMNAQSVNPFSNIIPSAQSHQQSNESTTNQSTEKKWNPATGKLE